jgi:hypothetical protein
MPIPLSDEQEIHIQQFRWGYINRRWSQLNALTKDWGDKAISYLMLTNAGGAVAVLSFMASDKVRKMVGPRIALCCFALGVIFTGILVAKQLHRFEGLYKGYKKDSQQYLAGQMEWATVVSEDDKRVQASFWDYGLGYVAFILFIGGCMAGGISLFRWHVNWLFWGLLALVGVVALFSVLYVRSRKRSATPKKSKAKGIWLLVCLFVLAFGVVAYSVNVATRYHAFTNELSAVGDIHIGDSREEVKYRLGFPQNVLGPMEEVPELGRSQLVYTVFGADNDPNKMPSTTKVEDYDEWVYEQPYKANARLTVKFNKAGFVESLSLYSDNKKPYGWGAIAGLNSGDSENKVLRLGQPSSQNLDGVSKTIEYRDIGIAVTLSKGRAYMITIKGPQEKAAVFQRFTRSLP